MAKGKATKKAKQGEKKRSKGGREEERGLMSSAGLMRYYDVEESTVRLSPKTIVLLGVLVGVAVLVLQIYFDKWPLP